MVASYSVHIALTIREDVTGNGKRLNVGFSVRNAMSPEGTADSAVPLLVSRPFATRVFPLARTLRVL